MVMLQTGGLGGSGSSKSWDMFPQTPLTAGGQATVTLSQTPKANRVFALVANNGGNVRVVGVQSVAGSAVTLLVQIAQTPSLAHAPVTDATALRSVGAPSSAAHMADSTGAWSSYTGGTCTAGVACNGVAHAPNRSVDTQGVISDRTDVLRAATPSQFAAVTSVPAHAAAALPVDANNTVDLIVFYEAV